MLREFLRNMILVGRLEIILDDGSSFQVGDERADPTAPDVAVRLVGRATPWKIALRPDPGLGEAYMDGRIQFVRGDISSLVELVGRNWSRWPDSPLSRMPALRRGINRRNARRNVAHHYDLSEKLYRLFLDRDMQYSCAYFARPDMTLEEAQEAKKAHIAAKLDLRHGQRVLDIGSGWGGLAITLAKIADVHVTGVTLSVEQHRVSTRRALEEGLADRVEFKLCDYRDLEGPFDRIVSVGMFEHVGQAHYREFFSKVHSLLSDDGIALLHSIGRRSGPYFDRGFIPRYIFPGGHIPALSEVMPEVEGNDLWADDIEILRLHYAETLRHWRERFMAAREQVLELYDERFIRMWEFYLVGCEMAFRHGDMMVFQMLLSRNVDAAPITRDYVFAAENEIRAGVTGRTVQRAG